MTKKDYDDSLKALYALAHSLGNNASEQNQLVDCIREIEIQTDEYKEKIKTGLGLFYDGLAYGNWPWRK